MLVGLSVEALGGYACDRRNRTRPRKRGCVGRWRLAFAHSYLEEEFVRSTLRPEPRRQTARCCHFGDDNAALAAQPESYLEPCR